MKAAWGAGATLVVLTLGMTWPLGARLTTGLPTNAFDPLLACWAMGWVSRTLTAALGHPAVLAGFWNANIYFPEPQALAFSDHFIGQSLMVLPVYWLTGNLIVCHNVAWLATFVLSGVGMFLLVRSLVTSPPAEGLPRDRGDGRRHDRGDCDRVQPVSPDRCGRRSGLAVDPLAAVRALRVAPLSRDRLAIGVGARGIRTDRAERVVAPLHDVLRAVRRGVCSG